MTYTKEVVSKLIQDYNMGVPVEDLALALEVPKRSVIAKLSSLGVYKKRGYVTKAGGAPRKKAEIIEKLADLLELDLDLCESLDKVSKLVLTQIERKLVQTGG